jgi:hypothetical protein
MGVQIDFILVLDAVPLHLDLGHLLLDQGIFKKRLV